MDWHRKRSGLYIAVEDGVRYVVTREGRVWRAEASRNAVLVGAADCGSMEEAKAWCVAHAGGDPLRSRAVDLEIESQWGRTVVVATPGLTLGELMPMVLRLIERDLGHAPDQRGVWSFQRQVEEEPLAMDARLDALAANEGGYRVLRLELVNDGGTV